MLMRGSLAGDSDLRRPASGRVTTTEVLRARGVDNERAPDRAGPARTLLFFTSGESVNESSLNVSSGPAASECLCELQDLLQITAPGLTNA